MAGFYGLFAHTDDAGDRMDVYREPERGGAIVVANGETVHIPGGERLRELRDALTAEIEREPGAESEWEWTGPESGQHPAGDLCYFCAADGQILAGLDGRAPATMHMQLPPTACPVFTPVDSQAGRWPA